MPLTLIESISTQATGLMSLLLHGRCITSVHAIFLGQSLQGGALPRLQLLGLNHTAIGDTGMVELARSLGEGGAPCSASLQDFWGNDCRVGPHGVRALVGAMRTYGACRHLQSLSLNKNRVGDQGVGYLAQGFEAGTFPALQILSLEKVHMSEEAARVLCRAVVHHCTHKIKLYLKGNHVRKDLWEEVM